MDMARNPVTRPTPKKPTTARKAAKGERESLSRDAWVEAALAAIAGGGLAAVSVERLAKQLGATKGSFYWHFKDRSDLVQAALARWEVRDTDAVIERASAIEDPRERLRSLFRLVFDEGARVQIDNTLLADADDPIVAAALERVTAKRLRYIDELFQAMGSRTGSDRAMLAYTAFIGLAQLRRTAFDLTPQGQRSASYIANITKWLID
jgi:AcrR family transcriptional regulator